MVGIREQTGNGLLFVCRAGAADLVKVFFFLCITVFCKVLEPSLVFTTQHKDQGPLHPLVVMLIVADVRGPGLPNFLW
jgi:hypothetical protein